MPDFFKRKMRLEVGLPGQTGLAIESLRIAARIEKTTSREPDKAQIQVYNLSETSRAAFDEEGAIVRLFAGYSVASLVFQGDIAQVTHRRVPPDVTTEVEASDGGLVFQEAQINESFGGPSTTLDLLNRIVQRMGLPLAYVDPQIEPITYLSTYTFSGPARDALTRVLGAVGAEWTIQDGAIVVRREGRPSQQVGPLISPDSGLIGSPEKMEDGNVRVLSLLRPSIVPGARFALKAKGFRGPYMARNVTLLLDSGFDQAFYTEIEASEDE